MSEELAQMEKIKGFFQEEERVTWAYLFGSRARGTVQAGSDWDIAVWLPTGSAPECLSICFEIQAALMEMLRAPADVVDLRGATLLLSHEVLKRRVVLVDREPLARSRWELKALGEYFDWLPYHRRYARNLIQELTTGSEELGQRGIGGESTWDIAPIHQ